MTCDECQKKIPEYVRGVLTREESAAMKEHISGCTQCRSEYEDLQWIHDGIQGNREMIGGGHIASQLLYEFLQCPKTLEVHTIDYIKEHVASCELCRGLHDNMQSILLSYPPPPPRRTILEHLAALFAIPKLRLASVSTAAAAAIIYLVVALGQWLGNPVAVVYGSAASVPRDHETVRGGISHEVMAVTIEMSKGGGAPSVATPERGGAPPPATPERVQRRSLDAMIFTIPLLAAPGERQPAMIRLINDATGKKLWQHHASEAQVRDGNLSLRFKKDSLEPGVYRVSVTDASGSILTSGFFEIY